MGPKRKKSKPNPEEEQSKDVATNTQKQQDDETPFKPPPVDTSNARRDSNAAVSPAPDRSSWYGSWRGTSKSRPVAAQIARESISVTQGATSESSSSSSTRPPISVSKSVRGSRKSVPLAAEATRVHATSDASDKSRPRYRSDKKPTESKIAESEEPKVMLEEPILPPEPATMEANGAPETTKVDPTSTWFGWWSRPDGYEAAKRNETPNVDGEVEQASSTPLPGTPVEEPAIPSMTDPGQPQEVDSSGEASMQQDGKVQPGTITHPTYWFGLWSTKENQDAAAADSLATRDPKENAPPEITVSAAPQAVEEEVKDANSGDPTSKPETQEQPKSSGWAFWSSGRNEEPSPTPGGTQKQIGELAVADTPSQSRPEAAQFNEQPDDASKAAANVGAKRTGSLLRPGRGKVDKLVTMSEGETSSASLTPSGAQTPVSQVSTPSSDSAHLMEASSILSRLPEQARPTKTKQRPNIVLPSFHETFPAAPDPGYMERLTNYLAQSLRLPNSETQVPTQHILKLASPPKIKKAVALGIHGYFPSPLVQKFLGQPKGTSIRFANYAATAVKSWCAEHQSEAKEAEIEIVALEGEGYIADRVSTLWKLLLNWLEQLRQADFILVACHSQGVPVAVMLVAKLIQLGCLAPGVRVGVCAMAGINLGPFMEIRSRFFGGTALELFEFSDSKSVVSKAYAESLELCLRHGVRVTFVGSIDDQLVSLESSLHIPLHHPYVNRAVFIDGRIHAPNFLTHLVIFALKLRNLGVSDHGLIRELSAPLAGSIMGGEGHSRVYDDAEVYKLAIHFALESTDITPPSTNTGSTQHQRQPPQPLPTSPALATNLRPTSLSNSVQRPVGIAPVVNAYEPPLTGANANPFYLPWAVRGMLEEDLVKKEMMDEVREMVREFDEWRPTSKVLKEVRWRLEGVKSMV